VNNTSIEGKGSRIGGIRESLIISVLSQVSVANDPNAIEILNNLSGSFCHSAGNDQVGVELSAVNSTTGCRNSSSEALRNLEALGGTALGAC